jgi:hypothetical protein
MTVFPTVDALKSALRTNTPTDFFDQFLLGRTTHHFDDDKIEFVKDVLSNEYSINLGKNEIVVVGSSKLGFALHKKIVGGTVAAPAFREFGEESDIDISICSHKLFDVLWHEISSYLSKNSYMPARVKKFGDYMAYGWLRADQIPPEDTSKLVRLSNLRIACSRIRRDRNRGHPKVNFGIFHDVEHLRLYQSRSIGLCKSNLENPL